MTGYSLILRERLDSLDAARQWAVSALSEYIKDTVPNESHRSIAVEVRDKDSRPLMKAVMVSRSRFRTGRFLDRRRTCKRLAITARIAP
ncbi:DUF6894 family protein [Mesorhizobium sp. AaZ16]|uniref:DUF6894 family protein n=1 Tax=Mesorhizobium sp. AaZ16 TaxID=3402289 RepID=UPI00374FC107